METEMIDQLTRHYRRIGTSRLIYRLHQLHDEYIHHQSPDHSLPKTSGLQSQLTAQDNDLVRPKYRVTLQHLSERPPYVSSMCKDERRLLLIRTNAADLAEGAVEELRKSGCLARPG